MICTYHSTCENSRHSLNHGIAWSKQSRLAILGQQNREN